MKKLSTLVIVAAVLLIAQSFLANKPDKPKTDDVKYVYCLAWQQAKAGGKNQPVVSNVFRFECDNRDYIILNEFHDYYDAYFKSSSYTGLQVKSDLKFMYSSRSEAETGRTQAIAKYRNNGNTPLLMEKFSVECED